MNIIQIHNNKDYIKDFIIEKTKLYFRPLTTLFKFIQVLNNGTLLEGLKILSAIEKVETNSDGDLYIGFKNNVIFNVNGSTVFNNHHELIVGYDHGSFGPDFSVDELVNISDINGSIISLVKKRKEIENLKTTNKQDFVEKISQPDCKE